MVHMVAPQKVSKNKAPKDTGVPLMCYHNYKDKASKQKTKVGHSTLTTPLPSVCMQFNSTSKDPSPQRFKQPM